MYNKFILQAIPRVVSLREYSSGFKKSGGFVYSMPQERQTDKLTGCVELICCHEGSLSCDMYDVTVEAGQLLCLPSELSVRLKAVTNPWRYTSLVINAEAIISRVDVLDRTALASIADGSQARYPTVIFPPLITDVSTVETVNCCVKKLPSDDEPRCNSATLSDVEQMMKIFSAITEYSEETARKYFAADTSSGYYELAVRYIDEHIAEKFSVSDIADAVEISYGHLTRVIKRTSGMSLVELINKMKLEEIKRLLKNTDLSLSEAGKLVGIDDGKYLSRLFKKYCGVTYSDFKKNM